MKLTIEQVTQCDLWMQPEGLELEPIVTLSRARRSVIRQLESRGKKEFHGPKLQVDHRIERPAVWSTQRFAAYVGRELDGHNSGCLHYGSRCMVAQLSA